MVNLTLSERDDTNCESTGNLDATLSENSVTVSNEENDNTEQVTVTVTIPDGQAADNYCWEVKGQVTNNPNPSEEASDTVDLDLEIPELKECSMSLSKTSLTLNPGQRGNVHCHSH